MRSSSAYFSLQLGLLSESEKVQFEDAIEDLDIAMSCALSRWASNESGRYEYLDRKRGNLSQKQLVEIAGGDPKLVKDLLSTSPKSAIEYVSLLASVWKAEGLNITRSRIGHPDAKLDKKGFISEIEKMRRERGIDSKISCVLEGVPVGDIYVSN